jgi:hypothetical protein
VHIGTYMVSASRGRLGTEFLVASAPSKQTSLFSVNAETGFFAI